MREKQVDKQSLTVVLALNWMSTSSAAAAHETASRFAHLQLRDVAPTSWRKSNRIAELRGAFKSDFAWPVFQVGVQCKSRTSVHICTLNLVHLLISSSPWWLDSAATFTEHNRYMAWRWLVFFPFYDQCHTKWKNVSSHLQICLCICRTVCTCSLFVHLNGGFHLLTQELSFISRPLMAIRRQGLNNMRDRTGKVRRQINHSHDFSQFIEDKIFEVHCVVAHEESGGWVCNNNHTEQ